jgi:putative acetyltransferase
MRHVLIQASDPTSPAARELIERLDKYLTDLYPAESNHLLSVQDLKRPNVTFLTAVVDGEVVGCGAFVNQGGDYAEIKRMFILPEFRGIKLGRRILEEIENLARASGLELARLETGIRQDEALHLYARAGYQRRGPFGDYPEDPLSIFMEKKL